MGTKLGTIAKRRLETNISNRRIYLKCKRKFGRGEWIRTTDLLVPNLGKAHFAGFCKYLHITHTVQVSSFSQ